jgi:Epoxide hydrolase N terminus
MWWAGRRRHFEGASLTRHIRWRKVEATLNALPQFITKIDGRDIQFAHVRSPHQDAPLLMTHGWPGSTIELLKVIEPLRFRARDVNLVMGPRRGASLQTGASICSSASPETSTSVPSRSRSSEITFLERGVEAYVFTFG